MKKYLMTGIAALAMCAGFTSCSHNDDIEVYSQAQIDKAKYDQAFLRYVGGTIAPDQDWGFSANITAASRVTRGFTRTQVAPSCPDINAPYDEDWVEDYLLSATEPTQANCWDNYDNSTYATNYGEGGPNYIDYGDAQQVADRNYFFGDDGNSDSWEQRVAWALQNHPSWVVYNKDESYIKLFKITGTWDGYINVVASEGYLPDHVTRSNAERTVVVTGTWNINDQNQRIGAFGRIIVANGGTINIAEGKALELVNQARLVVLRGGSITGEGEVMVTNGNAEGLEGYNAGTIDIHKVNNNFGKFYNYGVLKADIYAAGAQESNIYNHGKVIIGGTKETSNGNSYYVSSNARIYNACQWWCKGDQRARNIEMVSGSYMQVDGELMLSSSEDETTDPTYVGMAANSLIKCGTLYNNGTSWTGPTDGYAVVSTGQITYLNWAQDTYPLDYGYFENNIYLQADNLSNIPTGNGYQAGETATAEWKFKNIVANGLDNGSVKRGNGNVRVIGKGNTEIITPDPDFELGVNGCTPGFSGDVDPVDPDDPDDPEETTEITYDIRIMGEDLSADEDGDFDFNDIVLDVKFSKGNETTTKVCLRAAGGTLPLYIIAGGEQFEVHELFGVGKNVMVNTANGHHFDKKPVEFELKTAVANAEQARDNIVIKVEKNGTLQELTARISEPAAKIAITGVAPGDWLDERTSIKEVKTQFVDWASQNKSRSTWW